MIPLELPQISGKEDKTIATICKRPDWQGHHAVWQAAYDGYRAAQGDPWTVTPAIFTTVPDKAEAIAELQRGFYTSRSGGGPIARIRKTPGLLCCPMCGSGHPGSVDHYLPRKSFPEFSILPCNLVPACPHCNSGEKGGHFRGTATPERFIHPYFSTIANVAIWFVEIQPPYEAARFLPRVADSVAVDDHPMVQFHLDHILGAIFQDHISTQWSVLPRLVGGWLADVGVITDAHVAEQIKNDLRDTEVTNGPNAWRTALLRGLSMDAAAISFIASQAANVTPVPS